MRALIFVALFFLGATGLHAQVQERKLMDRLLEPNMKLRNDAQDKHFETEGRAVTAKKAPTKPFFLTRWLSFGKYPKQPTLATTEFPATTSRFDKQSAHLAPRNRLTNAHQPYATTAFATEQMRGADKSVATAAYPATRPFLVHGKSQGSLNTHNRPMTIEEVRELLNKNK